MSASVSISLASTPGWSDFIGNIDARLPRFSNDRSESTINALFIAFTSAIKQLEQQRSASRLRNLMALSSRFDQVIKGVKHLSLEPSLKVLFQSKVIPYAGLLIDQLKVYPNNFPSLLKQIEYLKFIVEELRKQGSGEAVLIPYYAQILRLSKGTFDEKSRRSFFLFYEEFIRRHLSKFEQRLGLDLTLPNPIPNLRANLAKIKELYQYGLNNELIEDLYLKMESVLQRSSLPAEMQAGIQAITLEIAAETAQLNRSPQLPFAFVSPIEKLWQALESYRTEFKEAFAFATPESIASFQTERYLAFQTFFQETLIRHNPFLFSLVPNSPHPDNPEGFVSIYAVGSLGRRELTPYSDLELFILIKKETDRHYGQNLCELLELTALAFAEGSPRSADGISSNDLVRKGLYLDLPSDVKTPEELAAAQDKLGPIQDRLYETSILKSSLIQESHPSLFREYQERLRVRSFKSRSIELLQFRMSCFEEAQRAKTSPVHLKTHYMELLFHTLNDLSLFFQIEESNTLEIIQRLKEKQVFDPITGDYLAQMVARLYYLRIKVQIYYDSATEEILLNPPKSPKEAQMYLATPEEISQLNQIDDLILIPLFNALKKYFNHSSGASSSSSSTSSSSLETFRFDLVGEVIQIINTLAPAHPQRSSILKVCAEAHPSFQQAFTQRLLFLKKEALLKKYTEMAARKSCPEAEESRAYLLQKMQGELAKAQNDCQAAQQRCKDLTQDLSKTQHTLRAVEERKNQLEQKLKQVEAELQSQQACAHERQLNLQQLQHKFKELEEKSRTADRKMQTVQAELQTMQAKAAASEKEYQMIQEKRQALQIELFALQESTQAKERQYQEELARCQEVAEKSEKSHQAMRTQSRLFEERWKESEEKQQIVSASLELMEKQSASQQQELCHLQIKVDRKSARIQELKSRLAVYASRASSASSSSSIPDAIPISQLIFGKAMWEHYFGPIVEAEPALPSYIHEVLSSPCPFWAAKTIAETHLLFLVPSTVNGQPYTLDLLGKLIQKPQGGGCPTKYHRYMTELKSHHGKNSPSQPYWCLMTKDVLPGTRKKSYIEQNQTLASLVKAEEKMRGEAPTALEAATCMLMEHVRTGRRLFSDNVMTFTRCTDQIFARQVIIGGFCETGLRLYNFSSVDDEITGLACAWKF